MATDKKPGPVARFVTAPSADQAANVRFAFTELREVIVGPLGAQLGKATGTAKRFEYFNNEHLNYGLVNVRAEGNQPSVEIEILTDKYVLLHKIRIGDSGKAS